MAWTLMGTSAVARDENDWHVRRVDGEKPLEV